MVQKVKIVNVTAAVLINNGKLFIAKRPHDDPLADKWELPGGKVHPGETPEDCLQREMYEEFGMEVTVHEPCGENTHHYDHISIRLMAYKVQWTGNEIHPVAHDEISWVSAQNLDNYDFAPADIPLINEIRRKNLVL